jgi:Tfp pilus assembly PilM family ATPase
VLAYEREEFVESVDDLQSLDKLSGQLRSLTAFVQRHNLGEARVMITCDGATAFNRYVEAPMMTGSSLDSLVAYEAGENIPFSLDEVFWDYRVLDVRHEDQLAEIILFAIKKEVVEARLRAVKRTGLPVDGVQLAPVALLNFLQHEDILRDGTAVVWVDYDRIDIAVRCRERVWFRTLPDGSHRLVEGVRDALNVKHREAVRVLRGETSCSDPDGVASLRVTEATRIAGEVARVLRYYSGAQEAFELKSVVVVAGTSVCPPLGSAFKTALDVKVFGLKRLRKVQLQDGIATPEISEHPGRFGPAIGCALQLRGMADIPIELYPKETKRFIAGRRLYHALTLLLVTFLVLANYWRSNDFAQQAESASVALKQAKSSAERLDEAYNAGGNELSIRRRLDPYTRATKGRIDVVQAMDQLLGALEAANSKRPEVARLHIVRLGGARSPSAESTRIQLTLAQETVTNGSVDALTQALQDGFLRDLVQGGGVSEIKVVAPFVAGDLVLTPPTDESTRLLRRRFAIWRISFLCQAANSGSANG